MDASPYASPMKIRSRVSASPTSPPESPTKANLHPRKRRLARLLLRVEFLAWMFLAALWVCWVFFMPGRYQQSPMGSAPGVSSHPSPRRLMVRDGSTAAFQGFSLPWSERQGSAVTETTSADVVPYLAKLLGASPDPPDRPVNRVTVIKGEGADEAVDIISNEPGRQPLYRIAHNFLADAQFERIRAALIDGTIAHAPSPLSNGFSLTTGAMFSFSAAGEKVFRALLPSCPELAAVWEFFGTIRRPDTNAFVINVLHATGTDNADGGWVWSVGCGM
ncbi:hypothetical protein FOA52_008294 [Chlamydomonas sp. UWO 241]|nr:hypothetical protein FOA52_008294 [Chlamydomonas sp. UWO 241]